MKRSLVILGLVSPVFAGAEKNSDMSAPSSRDGWEWSLSAGPSIREIGELKTNVGSRSSGFALPALVGSPSVYEPDIGQSKVLSDRSYDDGYVRQDAGTPNDGSTWNWGYDSASQVQGGDLVFAATGFRTTVKTSTAAPGAAVVDRDDLSGFSPHIQLDALSPIRLGAFRLGFSGGLDFTRVNRDFDTSGFVGKETRRDFRLDYEDRYSLDGVVPPPAPYAGTLEGPGPLIFNVPTSRSMEQVFLESESAVFSNEIGTEFDLKVFSLTLGPTLNGSWEKWDAALQFGLIGNIYDWEMNQDETLRVRKAGKASKVAEWSDKGSGTKFRPGLFVQTDLSYRITEEIAIGGFARFDTSQDFSASVGPSRFELDPGGFSGGVMVRFLLP